MKKTTTSSFGIGKRESHDASAFYARNLYSEQPINAPSVSDDEQSKIQNPKSMLGPTASTVSPPPR